MRSSQSAYLISARSGWWAVFAGMLGFDRAAKLVGEEIVGCGHRKTEFRENPPPFVSLERLAAQVDGVD